MKKRLLIQLVFGSLVLLASATCATAQIPPPTPEILYYRFDGTGTTVPNQALTPPPGTATANIMGSITQGSTGQCNTALVGSGLSATTDYLNTNWAPNLGTSSWSISFWTSNIIPSSTLFYIFGDIGTASFRCFTNGVAGPNNWIIRGAGLTDVTVSGGATTAPHMTTFVYDNAAGNMKGYLDGVLVTTVTQGAVNFTGTGPLKVMGYSANVGAPAGGLLDEYRLYNRAITAAEVLALYQRNTYATLNVNACGTSYTSPSGNNTWTTPGTYSDVLTGANMYCGDSNLTINLSFTAPVTPTVSIAANPGTSVCPGSSVTFTATPTNGGTPTYQWYKNGVLQAPTGNTYTDNSFTTGTTVHAIMTSTLPCVSSATATSNTLTMTVLPTVTPDVTIAANPGTTICPAQSVTFTATPVNGGTPTYQWFKNNVLQASTTNTFTDNTITNGATIKCVITPVGVCASTPTDTSNILTMTVNPNVTPDVSIASNQGTSVCAGTSVTFTATPTNAGTPTYQWFKNNVLQASTTNTFTDNTLTNGNTVRAVITSSGVCTTTPVDSSNIITMTIIPTVTPDVTISVNPSGAICEGMPAFFLATPTNGGTTPAYQWFKNNVLQPATGNTYEANNFANSDVIKCVLTSNEQCPVPATDTSNNITMNITAATNSLAGAAGTTESNNATIIANTDMKHSDCDLMATITPSGGNPINTNTIVRVTIDNTVTFYNGNTPYVQRHYDIEPDNATPTTSATITLYAYQSEFDAYNAAAWGHPPLPSGGVDNGNVKITQFHGTGTAPGNYTGAAELIIPTVNWDATNNWWEMTFPVTGFSGFYIHTAWTDNPLAITLKNIKATNIGSANRVNWETATEDKGDIFALESSIDGKIFNSLTTIPAKGSPSVYTYNDEHPAAGITYYRLKLTDNTNVTKYSNIASARMNTGNIASLQAYPNPAKDKLTITVEGNHSDNGVITITDMMGRVMSVTPLNSNQITVDISKFSTGNYIIKYIDDMNTSMIKVTKQ